MEILGEAFLNLQDDGDAEARMEVAIERANSAIFQMSHDLPQLSSMATTVVALHLNGNVATIGHVGDSRLYRLSPEGELFQETLDHSVVEEEVRAGRMTPEQAAVHPSRNVISRALGAEPLVDIDLKTIMVEPNTRFIVCSDGVTRHIEDHELRELLHGTPDEIELCETIKNICYDRGAEDNLTAVVVTAVGAPEEEYKDAPYVDEDDEETISTARTEADEAETLEVEEEGGESEDISFEGGEDEESLEPGEGTEESEAGAVGEDAEDETAAASVGNDSFLSILSEGGGSDAKDSGDGATDARSGSAAGAFAKVFLGLILFVAGVGVGAGSLYVWNTMSAEPPEAAPVEPPKVELTSFEQAKAKVYEDPAAAIATMSANPQTAEDHYFLGLAYLLNKRYDEAGIALNNAVAKLPDYDPTERGNLSREIALAKAVVDNPDARTAFETTVDATAEEEPEGNANIAATDAVTVPE
jgi:serine/threonine protein phosphatase PrpC